MEIIEGQPLTIECKVNSYPHPTQIKWRKKSDVTNDVISASSTLHINVMTRKDTGVYLCQVINSVGTGEKDIRIVVLYPPDLYIQYENYTQEEEERVLTCNANGVPEKYLFYEWEHKSDHGNHIRFLIGSQDGVLHLPTYNIKQMRYQDNGYYKCTVTNGITDSPPIFVADNSKEIFGEYQKAVSMHVNVYSNPKYTILDIVDHSGHYITAGKHIKIIKGYTSTTDMFHGTRIHLKGYKVTVNIERLTDEYLQDYTFRVKNEFGRSRHSITVRRASTPDIPLNVTTTLVRNDVRVEWVRNFNGGYRQCFFIEYRHEIGWKRVQSFNCTTEDIISWTIPNLHSNNIYMFRMFSRNRIGDSNRTEEIAVKIGSENNIIFYYAMVGSAPATLILVMAIGAFVRRLRRPKKNTSIQQDPSQNEPLEARPYGPYDEINEDEIIDNVAFNPDQETDVNSEYEQPVNFSTIKSESDSSRSSSNGESNEEDINENHTFTKDVCLNSYEHLTDERQPNSPYTTLTH
ncbi:unnamed protein product [Mytilus coruscus]|uniref:Ig-like domain-containing protein n=1 Tax=Mytilus coruscus TaxID=42192 RepID=A0A6J8CY15_MYTCO|nr:unnamed protein product [Mytilus coruscus]